MDSHRIKGFYIKAFIWQNKGFFIEKIYIQRIKRKLRSTFYLLLNLDLLLFFSKSRKYKNFIVKE